ncbi:MULTISPECIES: helix-turn-helix domain-containing protein [Pyrobaculum]|uniref:Transcription regulator TrmB N-terminal domain-containing protein n=2 Tax=Pyrobaculum arsenaticum TaxID=121277 RepID=A4WJG9_PYRAR|nr:helix-turn-helix domain-containing protein [Pyrobaculum arsenaticum]ABP50536.1 conserved hypothetical protein [Pyrobaculum arsenaticum DSM 13514]MCY0890523.1 TrmB family transcriptional regulator [Pyrobaculum arsenaticum]NYR14535.1 TrmB family transcriptional regulator [Pyrobaculum arsenaticum]
MLGTSSRLYVIERLLVQGEAKAYDLAKTSPFAISTIYYTLRKLEDEGCVIVSRDVYMPTFKCVLEYYREAGCGDAVKSYFRRSLGEYADLVKENDICQLLDFLVKTGACGKSVVSAVLDAVGGRLADVKKLPEGVTRAFTAALAAGSEYIDAVHKGAVVGGVFVGYCKRCGLVVAPCPLIK